MTRALDRGYRLAYRIGFLAARSWWFLRRPRHEGVLVAIWVGDRVLIVRQSYRETLCFPGGGVNRGETPAAAAIRELSEEIGLTVAPGDLGLAYEAIKPWDYRRDHVRIFELRLEAEPALRIDNREIIGARFVPAGACREARVNPFVAEYLANVLSDHIEAPGLRLPATPLPLAGEV
ncbi:MAG TPA: NUDIX hydrolase, partial [Acetobacteraceae bacterium]|nr:NUDIX hydrolase [Acetobacteraceae bacterium]